MDEKNNEYIKVAIILKGGQKLETTITRGILEIMHNCLVHKKKRKNTIMGLLDDSDKLNAIIEINQVEAVIIIK